MSRTTPTSRVAGTKSEQVDVADAPGAHLDVDAVADALLGTWSEARLAARELAARPEVQRIEGQTFEEHRRRVFDQLHLLVREGGVHRAFPKRLGGGEDHGGNIAGFEELVLADPSLQIKGGVQWGLFGSAIQHLGSREHQDRWLPDAMSLAAPGAFAMTEIGHGSDVASLGTTATYDPETEQFVVDTPFAAAWKEFLGNAAHDGRAAVVFAQLITQGVNHGVHCFYVPIRDEHGMLLDGIQSRDDGLKGGLNGIDNGRLAFDHVRIPRTNLLNRYGDVAPDGTYSSPIASPGRRFFTMLGTLVQGRVSLDGAATTAAAAGLTIAVTYGNQRRQFDDGSAAEQVLLDYQRHQRRLLPRLATTYAQVFAHDRLLTKFDQVFSTPEASDADRQDLETLAAALKPLSTWHALDALQESREACGGAGFMAENRLVGLRADLDVYTTFEGDNTVLLQLVAKRLLGDYAQQFKGADARALARFAVKQAAGRAVHDMGLRRIGQIVADFGSTARSVSQLRDTDDQRELLTDRVESMVAEVANALKDAHKLSAAEGAELFNEHQNTLVEAGRAHAELLQWEAFTEAVEKREWGSGTRQILVWLRDLFGLGLIEKHLSWYLVNGRLSPQRGQAVSAYINRLLARLRPHAQDLVDAFGYRPEHLRATIATGIEAERQDEAAQYYRDLAASGQAPTPEKKPAKK